MYKENLILCYDFWTYANIALQMLSSSSFSFCDAGYIFHDPCLNYVTVNYHLRYNCYHQHCWCIQSVTFHIPVDTLLSSRHYHYGITICCTFRASAPPLCSLLMKLILLLCSFSLCPDFDFVLTCYSCILVYSISQCGISRLVNNEELIILSLK